MPTFVPEVLTALDLYDVFGRHFKGALDMRQRERISLATDFHHQAAHHRQGQRHLQVETTALAGQLRQLDRTTQVADHVLHRIQADTTARHFGDLVAQTEARQEQEGQQLGFAHLRYGVGRRQAALDDVALEALKVDARAIIAQFEDQQPGLVRGAQADRTSLRFARQQAPLGQFNAMVDGIAQQMGQGRFEFFQHITIDLGFLAFDVQMHLLAKRTPEVTNHAGLAGEYVGERAHATGQCRVVQQLGSLAGLPAKLVEVGGLLLQDLLGFQQQALGLRQGIQHLGALATVFKLRLQTVEGTHALAVHAFEALQGGQVGLQALGLDQ